ncbi:Putative L,D-transpeptidase YkuD [Maioricimonas rarisocia]|uniref:L,D-transpeptidase YkuD n=1 Tax=Maioricimonas rarisocia TaxID=2528026 RepID=A0A517Z285_9PLAN|nr:L,D-transpeptidase family protein [Maioricimonas rarisocia]QDU36583.1 Putative L,D-transpeptidase YkuD [Maioricimonas rarisocia]
MDRRPPRRHPLQSFQFWFLVLGAAALTAAWRFDLLPFEIVPPGAASSQDSTVTEITLPEPSRPDDFETDETIAAVEDNPFAVSLGEPAPLTPGTGESTSEEISSEPGWPLASLPDTSDATSPFEVPPQAEPEPATGPYPTDASPRPMQTVARADAEHESTASSESTIRLVADTTPPAQAALGPAANSAAPFDFTEIDRLIEMGQDVEAHRQLSTLYWKHLDAWPLLKGRLEETARRIYFHPQPHYMPACEVQPGDRLEQIARRYDVSWQYLADLNRVEPHRIRAGQKLKVIRGPFSAVVDMSDFQITIHAHGYFVARYPVGIGKDGSTPIGRFTVKEKLEDPTYYGPDGVIANDDPTNPLGERWIDLGDSYGIHGTIEPDSIGKAESRGCVRLTNENVAEVYKLLTVGSEVVIRR